MTASEIIAFLERVNYTSLFFTIGETRQKFGPGREKWTTALANLTDVQQQAISERLEHAVKYVGMDKAG